MSSQTGAQLLVKSLGAQRVRHVFRIPGAQVDRVFDALVNRSIPTVVCRHEQNAAFIAGATRPGVRRSRWPGGAFA